MAFLMSRQLVENLYRNYGGLWTTITGTPSTATQFIADLKANGELVSVVQPALSIGTIVNKMGNTDQFIISQVDFQSNSEKYTLLKLNQSVVVSRFTEEVTRDSSGRVSTTSAAVLYPCMPVHLAPQNRSKPDDKADRSDEATLYRFTTSSQYVIQVKDQLNIGSQSLVVSALLLANSGLCQILCTDTA